MYPKKKTYFPICYVYLKISKENNNYGTKVSKILIKRNYKNQKKINIPDILNYIRRQVNNLTWCTGA